MKKLLSFFLSICIVVSISTIVDFNTYASVIYDREPNNTLPTAIQVSLGDTIHGEIGSYNLYTKNKKTDIDYYKINLLQGNEYTIKMANYSAFYRETTLIVKLISPDNQETSIGHKLVYSEKEKLDICKIKAEKSGTYYIKLYNYFDLELQQPHYYSLLITDNNSQRINSVNINSTKITKIKNGKKKVTAFWKTVKGIDGYQIQYSLKKNMKRSKRKIIKGSSAKKLLIKNLKSKKIYYFRIRTYKNVGGEKEYGKWSAKKKIKTK
ncbi:MAG: fibronectin type III domain-containing protein [Eubacterium sp.]|nr:fibronectin type III domain-containing protein [Eubacterium sp.]